MFANWWPAASHHHAGQSAEHLHTNQSLHTSRGWCRDKHHVTGQSCRSWWHTDDLMITVFSRLYVAIFFIVWLVLWRIVRWDLYISIYTEWAGWTLPSTAVKGSSRLTQQATNACKIDPIFIETSRIVTGCAKTPPALPLHPLGHHSPWHPQSSNHLKPRAQSRPMTTG